MPVPEAASARPAPGEPSPRYRVLIADDVAALRGVLRRVLEESGRFDVVGEAADGRQAVDLAERETPDLALLDLSMPVLDGLRALPEIRRLVPTCTVVVLSGMVSEAAEREARRLGASGYLPKVTDADHLVSHLITLLETPEGGVAPGAPVAATPGGAIAPLRQTDVVVPALLTSPGEARRFVRQVLEDWSLPELVDAAMLLATELVTNAVVHARSRARLAVVREGDVLRVEVSDHGGGAVVMRDMDLESGSGRGLHLVEAFSRSWGTSAGDWGKLVWFELDCA